MAFKVCADCECSKQLFEFQKDKSRHDGVKVYCIPCWRVRSSAYRKANPHIYRNSSNAWKAQNQERVRAQSRKHKLMYNYGITVEEFDAMVDENNGKCPICLEKTIRWHVDHDHKTGKVRGLLCNYCNPMLGMARENPETLLRAIQYLQES